MPDTANPLKPATARPTAGPGPGPADGAQPEHLPGKAILLALLVCLVWGINFVVIKVGVTGLPPLLLAALRFILSALPAVLFVRRPQAGLGRVALYGLLLGVGEFGCLFTAMKLGAPAGLSSIVLQSQAFFTALLAAAFFGEPLRWNHLAGMGVAALGLALIVSGGGQAADSGGLSLALAGLLVLGALGWAGANVTVRTMPGVNALELMVWSSLFSPLPLLGLSAWLEGPQSWIEGFASLGWPTVLALAYLVLLSTLFGYGAWNHLISRHGASRIAPFSLLVPVAGLSAAGVFLGEKVSAGDLLAAVLVLAGLALHLFGGRLWRRYRRPA